MEDEESKTQSTDPDYTHYRYKDKDMNNGDEVDFDFEHADTEEGGREHSDLQKDRDHDDFGDAMSSSRTDK